MKVEQKQRKKIQAQLIDWYHETKRDLPWRDMVNPYYTWISEVMLQQTQVDTVIPYYERFIARFPSMKSLAEANEEEVLKYWEGLGYYSRARNLQAGVREVVETYGGKLPTDRAQLLKIKGIGPYTSGAILSIAFNLPEPAVDGNVMRVLSRLFVIEEDIAKPKTRKIFEEILYQLIPEAAASDFNQGLMELGALICKPKSPNCSECPLNESCEASRQNRAKHFPIKLKKTKQTKKAYQVVLIKDELNQVLVHQRPSNGLLANLWEFPMVPFELTHAVQSQIEAFVQSIIGSSSSFTLEKLDKTLSHTFSHLKWDLNVWRLELSRPAPTVQSPYKWIKEEALSELPFPVAHQKIAALL